MAEAHQDESKASRRGEGVPVTALDGDEYRVLLQSALAWLDRHREIVNSLNVFPVPDGDTGTNMLLTLRSAVHEIERAEASSVAEVAHGAAQGALMGARGNSGVILSQILRGMSRSLDNQPNLTGPRFAAALAEGSRLAYKGVNRPVEGTILTVVREAATAAERAASLNPDLRYILQETVRAADEAVASTPSLLPVLAQAGKVDSGGKGLFYILDGMYRELIGQPVETAGVTPAPAPGPLRQPAKGQRELPAPVYGFDVQCLIEGKNLDVDAIREQIAAMGDCALVEGDSRLVKIHVHVPDPGVALSYAVTQGFITDVVVENMDDMHVPEAPQGEVGVSIKAVEEDKSFAGISGAGIIAVAQGAGISEVFESLGAHIVIAGGQTMNPSTKDILEAIQRLPVAEIIILPNNGNVIMAAQQAQALASSDKRVAIVPSRTIPQGISALLALSPHANLERNVQTMTSALEAVVTGEVTTAVQDAQFDGIEIKAGDVIGLLNDKLTAVSDSSSAVVNQLLEQMQAQHLEVITLYYGEPVEAAEAAALLVALRARYHDQEIELIYGGQPFYDFIISAE